MVFERRLGPQHHFGCVWGKWMISWVTASWRERSQWVSGAVSDLKLELLIWRFAQIWSQITSEYLCFFPLRIDQKVSNSPYGYKLQETQAILNEVRSIRDAISSGEKEKQELMQVKCGVTHSRVTVWFYGEKQLCYIFCWEVWPDLSWPLLSLLQLISGLIKLRSG